MNERELLIAFLGAKGVHQNILAIIDVEASEVLGQLPDADAARDQLINVGRVRAATLETAAATASTVADQSHLLIALHESEDSLLAVALDKCGVSGDLLLETFRDWHAPNELSVGDFFYTLFLSVSMWVRRKLNWPR